MITGFVKFVGRPKRGHRTACIMYVNHLDRIAAD